MPDTKPFGARHHRHPRFDAQAGLVWLPVSAAAEVLGSTSEQVYKLVNSGVLSKRYFGPRWLAVRYDEVVALSRTGDFR